MLSLVLLSCTAQEKTVEDKLYACITQHYKEHNIDLDTSLDSLENYLVSKKILTSKDGAGKIKFLEDVVKNGYFPDVERIAVMDDLTKNFYGIDFVEKCLFGKSKLDSLEYVQSKFYRTTQAVRKDAVMNGTVTPVSVAKAMISNMTEEDFEKPIYRAHMLIAAFMIDYDYQRELPKQVTKESINPEKGFTIELLTDDKLLLNGKQGEPNDLESELLKYFDTCDESRQLRIMTHPQTEYELFAKVQTSIEMAYQTFHSRVALRDYKKEFSKLNATEQREIKELYPARIIEIEKK